MSVVGPKRLRRTLRVWAQEVSVVDYETDPGLPWEGDERLEPRKHRGPCPECALPMRWVDHPNPNLRGWTCYGPESIERHAAIATKQRAAAACFAAGYPQFGEVIASDLDRLRQPRRQAA